jgi:hypothetical protein
MTNQIITAADGSRTIYNDQTRTVTSYNAAGTQTAQRAYTPAENAVADAEVLALASVANKATLQQQATTARANNATYLAIASPTNAQVAAQVRALTQQNNAIIRLLTNALDATT